MASSQHVKVVKQLKELLPKYTIIEEYYLGNRLHLDIYIPAFSVGIELNGKQHYEFSSYFHGSPIGFEEYKLRDRKKLRLCQEQGIGLMVIRYDEEFDPDKFMSFALNHMNNYIE